ncbi:MAG: hypothetical protein DHS20C20_24410 [Ardenticatenaceae bacterium]|nr:MAG: hypothetical protein DHS20C20_24410 [Ardenticatenaceae bacterium]
MTYRHLNDRDICILVVEDNPVDARRFEFMLSKSQDTYKLYQAKTLETAVHMLGRHKISVVLLDLTLPDSDGVQTVRTVHTNFPRIPIVVLTGVDDDQVIVDAATAGAQDYLIKQEVTPTILWRVLRYAIERQSQEEALRASRRDYQRQAEELNMLNRIISATTMSNDEQTILDIACFNLAHFYHAQRVLILEYQPEPGTVAVQADYSQDLFPLPPISHPVESFDELTAVLLSQHTLMCPTLSINLRSFLAVSPETQAILRSLNMEGNTIGFFVLLLPETHTMEERDLLLVNMVTDEIELGLTKAGMHLRLQAHAEELESRVKERTQALAEANEQLQSLDKLKSKFVSDVSHELRNPIANLCLYLELLEFAKPDKQPQYITVLRNQVQRLSVLIEEILLLSRLENGTTNIIFQPVDLNVLVEQVFEAHIPRAHSKHLALQFIPTTSLAHVWGNPDQLTQVITNLVDNALNYTVKGGITISTKAAPKNGSKQLLLQVTDSGMGIPDEDLPYIFDRFYRGSHIDKKKMVGTGLGLGIVSEIVNLHNGRIDVTNNTKEGSTFTVTLPTPPQE